MRTSTRQDGFTLIELMVVVAIIGILSAVAIPNFKKYQAKSKASEAKLHLSSLYSAETSAQADYDYYVNCLNVVGYDPSKEYQNRYYAVGFFTINSAPDVDAKANGLTSCTSSAAHTGSGAASGAAASYEAGKKVAGLSAKATNLPTSEVTTDGAEFTAGAAGIVSPDHTGGDKWTMDENKLLQHDTTGY